VGDDLVAWGLVFAPLVLIYGGAAAWTCLRCRRRWVSALLILPPTGRRPSGRIGDL